ncbi:putative 3-mercaptopyruvate sulfurtransferase [Candidatus Accumulibacter aalborgensis]|uniref:Sulfurtransferase n=1 Tax=Candidatus Accumulibacter aalborgensis TaxID=1860102 RepID=A0A1A8XLH5_9PROT|nr:sulfurtransferase [Candidatus Accumulibacter aalborgensis]SBT05521.1 putative 3-mercaptopyruvate sulfurtransferase [Candidatus Accumulibacter aalborgensis]
MSHSTLVSSTVLADHLHDPGWRVFDCRHQLADPGAGARAYADGHLPGAFFLHLDADLSGAMTGRNGRHPLPDPMQLAARLGAAGVSRATQVIAYDDSGGMFASRLWWLLRWLGHPRVAVLDGGLAGWLAEGRALTTDLPTSAAAALEVALRDQVVSTETVLAHLDDMKFRLLDARSPDRFRGENETLDRVGGHIPGASNRFFRDNLDADGRFRPAAELRRDFLALLAGVEPEQVVMSCGSGVTACHNLLAMAIAGLPGARLYAGSWSEWCSDPVRPVAGGTP